VDCMPLENKYLTYVIGLTEENLQKKPKQYDYLEWWQKSKKDKQQA